MCTQHSLIFNYKPGLSLKLTRLRIQRQLFWHGHMGHFWYENFMLHPRSDWYSGSTLLFFFFFLLHFYFLSLSESHLLPWHSCLHDIHLEEHKKRRQQRENTQSVQLRQIKVFNCQCCHGAVHSTTVFEGERLREKKTRIKERKSVLAASLSFCCRGRVKQTQRRNCGS